MGGKFACIAVIIALNKPFVSQFLLDGKVKKVEYKCLPHIRFTCGKYGHTSELCPGRATEDLDRDISGDRVGVMAEKSDALAPGGYPIFGPLMVVTKKGKDCLEKGNEFQQDSGQGRQGQWSNYGRILILQC